MRLQLPSGKERIFVYILKPVRDLPGLKDLAGLAKIIQKTPAALSPDAVFPKAYKQGSQEENPG